LALECELPAIGLVDAGEHVEQRRLARAVRAYQPVDLALPDRKVDARQRLHAAEALGDALRDEQIRFAHARAVSSSRLRRAASRIPAGRNSIIATSVMPKSSILITSGSISVRPKIACCAGPTVYRSTSGTNDSSSAPRITPQILPMPPSTTIARMLTDSTRTKLSGLMNPWI